MHNLIKQFERLKNNGFFIQENDYIKDDCAVQYSRAIRVKNPSDNISLRTHNINLIDNQIWWESKDNSEGWYIEFDTPEEAAVLYKKVTGLKVIQKNYK